MLEGAPPGSFRAPIKPENRFGSARSSSGEASLFGFYRGTSSTSTSTARPDRRPVCKASEVERGFWAKEIIPLSCHILELLASAVSTSTSTIHPPAPGGDVVGRFREKFIGPDECSSSLSRRRVRSMPRCKDPGADTRTKTAI